MYLGCILWYFFFMFASSENFAGKLLFAEKHVTAIVLKNIYFPAQNEKKQSDDFNLSK